MSEPKICYSDALSDDPVQRAIEQDVNAGIRWFRDMLSARDPEHAVSVLISLAASVSSVLPPPHSAGMIDGLRTIVRLAADPAHRARVEVMLQGGGRA